MIEFFRLVIQVRGPVGKSFRYCFDLPVLNG